MSVQKLYFIFISFNFAKVPSHVLASDNLDLSRDNNPNKRMTIFAQNKVLIKTERQKCVPHALSNIYIENKNRNVSISWIFILQASKFCL